MYDTLKHSNTIWWHMGKFEFFECEKRNINSCRDERSNMLFNKQHASTSAVDIWRQLNFDERQLLCKLTAFEERDIQACILLLWPYLRNSCCPSKQTS